MNTNWTKGVLKNFEDASSKYNQHADLQRTCAWKLAQECSVQSIAKGLWVDLGSGTGLLADAIEENNPERTVLRVDGSKKMLKKNKEGSKTYLWDLNKGIPNWEQKPTLLGSSFVLHWLKDPYTRLEEWLSTLSSQGVLALAVPINESFPEWKIAAAAAEEPFTGLSLPSHDLILNCLKKGDIKYEKVESFTYTRNDVLSLLKPIINVGAHTKTQNSLSISGWKKIMNSWPQISEDQLVSLTWQVQLVIVQL